MNFEDRFGGIKVMYANLQPNPLAVIVPHDFLRNLIFIVEPKVPQTNSAVKGVPLFGLEDI